MLVLMFSPNSKKIVINILTSNFNPQLPFLQALYGIIYTPSETKANVHSRFFQITSYFEQWNIYKIVFILYYLTFRIHMYLISIIKPLQLKITVFSKNIFYQNRKVSGRLVKLYQIEIFVRTFEKLSGRLLSGRLSMCCI